MQTAGGVCPSSSQHVDLFQPIEVYGRLHEGLFAGMTLIYLYAHHRADGNAWGEHTVACGYNFIAGANIGIAGKVYERDEGRIVATTKADGSRGSPLHARAHHAVAIGKKHDGCGVGGHLAHLAYQTVASYDDAMHMHPIVATSRDDDGVKVRVGA